METKTIKSTYMKKLIQPLLILTLIFSSCHKSEPLKPQPTNLSKCKINHGQFSVYKVGNDTLFLAELDVIKVELNRKNKKYTVSWL